MIRAKIHVTLKKGILDSQGKIIHQALENLGIENISDVYVGKLIEINFTNVSENEARLRSEKACKKLLANPVIEDYKIELERQAIEEEKTYLV